MGRSDDGLLRQHQRLPRWWRDDRDRSLGGDQCGSCRRWRLWPPFWASLSTRRPPQTAWTWRPPRRYGYAACGDSGRRFIAAGHYPAAGRPPNRSIVTPASATPPRRRARGRRGSRTICSSERDARNSAEVGVFTTARRSLSQTHLSQWFPVQDWSRGLRLSVSWTDSRSPRSGSSHAGALGASPHLLFLGYQPGRRPA